MRKTTLAPGQLLHSLHMEKSYLGTAGYPVLYNYLIIMKFGTGIELDVFYTLVIKKFVTSLLLRTYDFMTCILSDA